MLFRFLFSYRTGFTSRLALVLNLSASTRSQVGFLRLLFDLSHEIIANLIHAPKVERIVLGLNYSRGWL